MKDVLLAKKKMLEEQLDRNQQAMIEAQTQFNMTQGAYQYNQLLLAELEAAEKVEEPKKD